MDFGSIALFLLTVFVGTVIQGVSGFGFGIFVMMVFPFLLPSYGAGVTVSGMLSILSNAAIAVRMRRHIAWKKLWSPLAANVVVSTAAIFFSVGQSDAVLKKLLGAFLILMSLYFLFLGGRFTIRPNRRNGAIAGGLGGLLGGLFGTGGPPMVVYLLASSESNEEYLGTIQAYFALTNISTILVRAWNGMMTPLTLQYWAIGLAALALGVFAGHKLFRRLDGGKLKKVVYLFMIGSGIVMLCQ